MSDASNQDESLKTEEPTPRRLEEAREKGQVSKSQEVNHWFMILAFALIVSLMAPSAAGRLASSLEDLMAKSHTIAINPGSLQRLLVELSLDIAVILALPLLVAFLAALLTNVVQSGFIFSFEPLKPKLSKISVIQGLKRLFSLRAVVEFVKGVSKLAIVSLVVFLLIWPNREMLPFAPTMAVADLLEFEWGLAQRVLFGVLAVMTVLAILDLTYQRLEHKKRLRMTKQEVKDEMKQSEGDPMIKARLRQIRAERARRRMMAAVPEADVVVTNPTHYAVAMRYDAESMNAPRVTAKGMDQIAMRIRATAEDHEVPIVEDPPLARALYNTVELDSEVPPEHYRAVAEIIGYVMRLKGKLKAPAGGSGRPPQGEGLL